MNFDSAVKIFLSFDEPWWPTDVHSIYFIWKDEDLEMIKKDVGVFIIERWKIFQLLFKLEHFVNPFFVEREELASGTHWILYT